MTGIGEIRPRAITICRRGYLTFADGCGFSQVYPDNFTDEQIIKDLILDFITCKGNKGAIAEIYIKNETTYEF